MTEFARKFRRSARSLFCTPLNQLRNLVDPPVIVLLYHRVTTLACDPEMLAVTPTNFRAQLRHLRENCHLVRFEADWTGSPRPAVAITFDDGYADNLLEALPILEELDVPATFFVSTGNIGSAREFWWHELERLILGGGPFPESFTLSRGGTAKSWPTRSAQERQLLYSGLVALMTGSDSASRAEILSQLQAWGETAAASGAGSRSLSIEELRRLAACPLATIGAHTVNHLQLSALPLEQQRQEMENSKRDLETWLGREITTFSYPYGKRSHYTGQSVRLCRELGFSKAASNFPGQAHRWSDPYQVPRHLVRDWPVQEFAARLKGFWTR